MEHRFNITISEQHQIASQIEALQAALEADQGITEIYLTVVSKYQPYLTSLIIPELANLGFVPVNPVAFNSLILTKQ